MPSYGHSTTQAPILAALYTGTSSGEPGMVLVSRTGELRFWESMSLALANVERFQGLGLELAQEDFVEKVWTIDVSRCRIPHA